MAINSVQHRYLCNNLHLNTIEHTTKTLDTRIKDFIALNENRLGHLLENTKLLNDEKVASLEFFQNMNQ